MRLALAALLAVTGTAVAAGPVAADEPAPHRSEARFEVKFMTQTIDHHFLAVKMGELCLEKATAPPPFSDGTLRATCVNIVAAQNAQIQKLQTWLADWYGIEKEPTLPPGGEQTLRKLQREDGENFDVDVSKRFIEHHRQLIPRAERCTEEAAHQELADLCAMMVQAQLEEIQVFDGIINDHDRRAGHGHKTGHDGHRGHGH